MKYTIKIFIILLISSVSVKAEVIHSKNTDTVPDKVSTSVYNVNPETVVAQYFEYLFKTGNFEAMSKIIAKDAIYYQAEGLPYGGTYVGFEQWITMFTKAQTYFNLQISEEPVYYSSPGNANGVIIAFTIKCVSKKSGKEIVMPISEHFKVKDGKIIEIRPFYFDTKAFAEFVQ